MQRAHAAQRARIWVARFADASRQSHADDACGGVQEVAEQGLSKSQKKRAKKKAKAATDGAADAVDDADDRTAEGQPSKASASGMSADAEGGRAGEQSAEGEVAKKKKKKKQATGPKQTEPPSVPIAKFFPSGVYPAGEWQSYNDECEFLDPLAVPQQPLPAAAAVHFTPGPAFVASAVQRAAAQHGYARRHPRRFCTRAVAACGQGRLLFLAAGNTG